MAAFPEDVLIDDEELARLVRPHWRVLVLPGLVTIAFVALVLTAWMVLPDNLLGAALFWIISIGGLALWGWFALRIFLRWRFTRYAFTTLRVIVRRGILTVDLTEIPLSKVNDVKVHKSLGDWPFGSGVLILGAEFRLDRVPDVMSASRLVNQLIAGRGHTKGVDVHLLEKMVVDKESRPPPSQVSIGTDESTE
jgi:hypothetical protein